MEKGVPTSRDKVGSRKRRIIRPTLGNTKKKPTPGNSSPSVSPTEDKIEKEGLRFRVKKLYPRPGGGYQRRYQLQKVPEG